MILVQLILLFFFFIFVLSCIYILREDVSKPYVLTYLWLTTFFLFRKIKLLISQQLNISVYLSYPIIHTLLSTATGKNQEHLNSVIPIKQECWTGFYHANHLKHH